MQIPTPINGDLSLYVHLPFCQKKCDYCHFFVLPNKDSYKKELFKALFLEIDLLSSQLAGKRILSLYFGGGTPSLVGPAYIESVIQAFSKYVSLDQAEITLELNPENHDLATLKNFRQVGVNRLSIGVQSFNNELLKKLGREHSSQDAICALENAQKAHFENLSIDLMYELPLQTLPLWQATLQQANAMPINHISLYNLTLEPHTVFYKHRQKIQKQRPSQETALKMYLEAEAYLKKHHWQPYEISALSKHGAYSRHNVGYWLQRDHLGFGPSAFSLIGTVRCQNVKNLKKYAEHLEKGSKPIDFSEQLSQSAFLRESLCLNLRLHQGVDLLSFEKRFGPLPEDLKKTLLQLERQKLIIYQAPHLRLSDYGRLHHDEIASEIISIED